MTSEFHCPRCGKLKLTRTGKLHKCAPKNNQEALGMFVRQTNVLIVVERERDALREAGWRLARALEAARQHGFHGGTALLTEWQSVAGPELPNDSMSHARTEPTRNDG